MPISMPSKNCHVSSELEMETLYSENKPVIYIFDTWSAYYRFNGFKIMQLNSMRAIYDDAIKWKHFPSYCPFVSGIPRSPLT